MVMTIVHSAATPMDVDTQTMSIEKEKSHGASEEYEDKLMEDHDSEQHGYQDEEGGPICCMGKSSEGGWKIKGKPKGERKIRWSMLQLREDGSPKQRLQEGKEQRQRQRQRRTEGKRRIHQERARVEWRQQQLQHRLQPLQRQPQGRRQVRERN